LRSPRPYQAQPRKTSSKLPALYTDAAKALAQITRIDEAKEIRDQAQAMQVYAEQAQDPSLIEHATKVRVHAETRCGELLLEMATQGTRAAREDNLKRGPRTNTKLVREKATLDDIKISQMQASRWKKLAMMKLAFPKNWEERLRRMCRMAVAVTEGNKAVLAAAKADLHAEKKRQRDRHERELAEKIYALPEKRFSVIYADPPWKFQTWSEKGLNASADNHYATSDISEIRSLDVDRIAADDCVLFLWATVPMLPEALEVMGAWGFVYVSHFCWVKNRAGTGYWNRNKHELLLIGKRGSIPAPAPGTQYESVIEAAVGSHSTKPDCFRVMIDKFFPTQPKIELYRRGPALPGWSAWGAEAEPISSDSRTEEAL
jgi:N6-adenosine-specific RNA methylase IME4